MPAVFGILLCFASFLLFLFCLCYPITFQVPISYIRNIYITSISCRCGKVFFVVLLLICRLLLWLFITVQYKAYSLMPIQSWIFSTSNIRFELGLRLFFSFYCKSVSVVLVALCHNPKWHPNLTSEIK